MIVSRGCERETYVKKDIQLSENCASGTLLSMTAQKHAIMSHGWPQVAMALIMSHKWWKLAMMLIMSHRYPRVPMVLFPYKVSCPRQNDAFPQNTT